MPRQAWHGVACSADGSQLLGLDLSRKSLSGAKLGLVLDALPKTLVSLSLAHSEISGQIPDSALCQHTALRFVDLSGNMLKGPLPECLSELRALETLSLASNRLHGSLPPLWARLEKLTALYLHGNQDLRCESLPWPLVQFLSRIRHLSLPLQLRETFNVALAHGSRENVRENRGMIL
jgi:hypothetical protein